MSATAHGKHLFVSEAGPTGICEACGQLYDHDNHKGLTLSGTTPIEDMHNRPEDERIDLIAARVRENGGQTVALLLEFGIGKVERYIRKLAERHPDIRVVSRAWGPSPLLETITFGPKVQG